jgi:anti-anti-sigma regulatory factor
VTHPDAFTLASRRLENGRLAVQLQGRFDGAAAAELRASLLAIPRGERIVVDFSRLHHVSDVALGMIGSWREELAPGCEVELAGLAHHATRILQAFAPGRAA